MGGNRLTFTSSCLKLLLNICKTVSKETVRGSIKFSNSSSSSPIEQKGHYGLKCMLMCISFNTEYFIQVWKWPFEEVSLHSHPRHNWRFGSMSWIFCFFSVLYIKWNSNNTLALTDSCLRHVHHLHTSKPPSFPTFKALKKTVFPFPLFSLLVPRPQRAHRLKCSDSSKLLFFLIYIL